MAAKSPLGIAAQRAAWVTLALGVACLIDAALEERALGALVLSFAAVEFLGGRIGVAWSDPLGPAIDASSLVKRVGIGAALGVGIAALALLVSRSPVRIAMPSASALFVGVLVAALRAARSELLLRGLPFRVLDALALSRLRAPLAVTLGVAFELGSGGFRAGPVLVAAGQAWVSALIWTRDRGAWAAIGTHFAFALALGALSSVPAVSDFPRSIPAGIALLAFGGGLTLAQILRKNSAKVSASR